MTEFERNGILPAMLAAQGQRRIATASAGNSSSFLQYSAGAFMALRSRRGASENIIDPESIILRCQERIKKLEAFLAEEIGTVAELLKENKKLELELEQIIKQRDCWRDHYRKIRPDEKIPCDRQNAMVVHSDINFRDILDDR